MSKSTLCCGIGLLFKYLEPPRHQTKSILELARGRTLSELIPALPLATRAQDDPQPPARIFCPHFSNAPFYNIWSPHNPKHARTGAQAPHGIQIGWTVNSLGEPIQIGWTGQSQRETPVTDARGIVEIVILLPGKRAAALTITYKSFPRLPTHPGSHVHG